MRGEYSASDVARFWSKVQKSDDGCWLWISRVFKDGYGEVKFRGRTRRANRVAYLLAYGPFPDDLQVLHRCDNRLCCRPDHLFLGTHKDNMADMVNKGRQASGDRSGSRLHPTSRPRGDRSWQNRLPERIQRGERHGGARLTAEQVAEMRRRFRDGHITVLALAREFGISDTHAGRIVRGMNWREV